jgi:hypothetical protein
VTTDIGQAIIGCELVTTSSVQLPQWILHNQVRNIQSQWLNEFRTSQYASIYLPITSFLKIFIFSTLHHLLPQLIKAIVQGFV